MTSDVVKDILSDYGVVIDNMLVENQEFEEVTEDEIYLRGP